MTILKRDSCS